MQFKTLKHKTLPNTFGVFYSQDEGEIRGADTEICHTSTPELLGKDTTLEDLQRLYQYTQALEQLPDYDLVTITITVQ